MQSTGVLNLSIGLTGVKENPEAHLSFISLARGRLPHSLCFPDSAPPPLVPPLQRRRYTSPPPVHAIANAPCHRRSAPPLHTSAHRSVPPVRPLCATRFAPPAHITTAAALRHSNAAVPPITNQR